MCIKKLWQRWFTPNTVQDKNPKVIEVPWNFPEPMEEASRKHQAKCSKGRCRRAIRQIGYKHPNKKAKARFA